jgi:hypothetical protein
MFGFEEVIKMNGETFDCGQTILALENTTALLIQDCRNCAECRWGVEAPTDEMNYADKDICPRSGVLLDARHALRNAYGNQDSFGMTAQELKNANTDDALKGGLEAAGGE